MAPRFDSPPSTPHSFSQPRPRPPRSPGHLAQIRAQNRRRAYLEKHSDYFQSSEHELSEPLLYDHLIRRFQTPAEREAEGRAKGYARVLEGSLLRGEERLAKLRGETVGRNHGGGDGTGGGAGINASMLGGAAAAVTVGGEEGKSDENGSVSTPAEAGTALSSLNAELTPPPKTRAEGRAQWEAYLRDRFIRGEDEDFDYARVDEDDEYDVLEREEREEAWFEEEDPAWATSGEEGAGRTEKVLLGETGVQDF